MVCMWAYVQIVKSTNLGTPAGHDTPNNVNTNTNERNNWVESGSLRCEGSCLLIAYEIL